MRLQKWVYAGDKLLLVCRLGLRTPARSYFYGELELATQARILVKLVANIQYFLK